MYVYNALHQFISVRYSHFLKFFYILTVFPITNVVVPLNTNYKKYMYIITFIKFYRKKIVELDPEQKKCWQLGLIR